jgi:hypothetical protein
VNYEVDGSTIVVAGRHITSRTNRAAEAAMQVSTVPEEADEAWVYGWGLGDIQRELLKRPQLKTLTVVPLNMAIFDAAVDFEPQDWMNDARVKLVMPDEIKDVYAPCCVYPADLRLADRNAWWLRDRLMAYLNQPFNAFLFQWMNTVWSSHLAENKPFLDVDANVLELSGTDTRDAIVIGGGPTLGLAYDWIRAQDMNVIVASTALRPLLAAGIEPDVVVVIDRDPKMQRHFETKCNGSLVYHPMVHPSIPAGWAGKRYVVQERQLFCGGSVIHNQIDLAVRMGAKTVYLAGLDFGYPGKVSHVAGAPMPYTISEQAATLTTNGRGVDIPTDPNLLQYRVCAEDFIASHPGVEWRKLGRDGSEMRGVEWFDV